MKGVIPNCLGQLVKDKFGKEIWEQILEKSGLNKKTRFLFSSKVDDETVVSMVTVACEVLGLTLSEIADVFGDYWINVFAPKTYFAYYNNVKSAREFLLKVDFIHTSLTKRMPDAQPPKFNYEWINDKVLIMSYHSKRGLIDFAVGLIKGVGKYYGEKLKVTKLSDTEIKIVFPN